jgi:proteasome lid subunit RPN8/RPN11
MSAAAYAPELLARIAAFCEADPAREVCGFVVRRGASLDVVPVENVADRYHERDPASFPRTSRESYLMEPRAQLRVQQELAASGGELVAVYHSHVEAGAYFSAKDREDAAFEGVQLLPGADYLVFGLRAGRVTEVKRFRFDAGEFVEGPLG